MSTGDFARTAGLAFNTAKAMARGNYDRIGLETIARLCDALNIQPGDLFEYTPVIEKSQEIT